MNISLANLLQSGLECLKLASETDKNCCKIIQNNEGAGTSPIWEKTAVIGVFPLRSNVHKRWGDKIKVYKTINDTDKRESYLPLS